MRINAKGGIRNILSLAAISLPLSLLALSACGGGGTGSAAVGAVPANPVILANDQAATVVIGQAYFTSNTIGTTAATLAFPYASPGVDPATGKLYIPDYGNNRVLVYSSIPTVNGASAAFAIGENNLVSSTTGTSASSIAGPQSPAVSGGKLYFADYGNNRVGLYNPAPSASPGTMSIVLGQLNFQTGVSGGCTPSGLATPETVSVAGNKVVVADGGNNRVLIWNSIPTTSGQSPDLVLGQPNLTTCNSNASGVTAASLSYAGGAWTDGTRIVVLDTYNNRVLIWKKWPTVSGQPADLVLGQPGFTSTTAGVGPSTMSWPYEGVFGNAAGQLFVADSNNNRVLVWNMFPMTNGQPADLVLGQTNMSSNVWGTSATTLHYPTGVTGYGNHVLVTDTLNNRVLVY